MLHQRGDSRRSIGPRGYSCSVLHQQPARSPRLDFGCKSPPNRWSDRVLSVQTIFPRFTTSIPRTSDTQLSPNSSQSPTHSRSKATSKGHASGSSGPTTRYPSAGGEGSFLVALRGIPGVSPMVLLHLIYLSQLCEGCPHQSNRSVSVCRAEYGMGSDMGSLAIAGAQLLAGSGVSTLMTCLTPT